MRFPRVKAEGRGFYHCVSRFVQGLVIFGISGDRCLEAEEFVALMHRRAAFSGIRILDYILMGNHFHIVCEVPEPQTLTQSELLERIEADDGPEDARILREQLARFAQQPDGIEQSKRLLEPYRRRMYDISIFNKELKGGFAQSYNRRHNRYGPVWSERFRSVLLEAGRAVATVAAYNELNPVRAGLCEDPKDYPYCGYAEAIAQGSGIALEGIRTILGLPPSANREEIEREYRKLLHLKDAATSENNPPAFDSPKAPDVVEPQKGELSLGQHLRCKIRSLSAGVILGSRAFVEYHCQRLKQKLGYKRMSGPVALKMLGPAGLWVFRPLRVRTFG
jgi:putative transposase